MVSHILQGIKGISSKALFVSQIMWLMPWSFLREGTDIIKVGKAGENIKLYILPWIVNMILSLVLARNLRLKTVLHGE